MTEALSFRAKTLLALVGAAICLVFLTVPPSKAQAAEQWTNYCGGQTLKGWKAGEPYYLCYGAARWVNGTMGMGEQRSVCVWSEDDWVTMCTSGPGAWVYNPGNSNWAWARPFIRNNAYEGSTVVQAVAWTSTP